MYRSEDIRKAMQMLADDKGRQYFERVVVNEAVRAYRDNTHHHLKKELDLILPRFARIIDVDVTLFKHARILTTDKQFRHFLGYVNMFIGAQRMLASLSGVGTSAICNALRKGYMLQATYKKMQVHFRDLEKHYAESRH